jgi:hypothetical protein
VKYSAEKIWKTIRTLSYRYDNSLKSKCAYNSLLMFLILILLVLWSLLLPKVLLARFSELLDRQTGLCTEQSALMKIQLANFMQKHVLRLYCWSTSMYIFKAYQSWKVLNFSLGSGAITINQHC